MLGSVTSATSATSFPRLGEHREEDFVTGEPKTIKRHHAARITQSVYHSARRCNEVLSDARRVKWVSGISWQTAGVRAQKMRKELDILAP